MHDARKLGQAQSGAVVVGSCCLTKCLRGESPSVFWRLQRFDMVHLCLYLYIYIYIWSYYAYAIPHTATVRKFPRFYYDLTSLDILLLKSLQGSCRGRSSS